MLAIIPLMFLQAYIWMLAPSLRRSSPKNLRPPPGVNILDALLGALASKLGRRRWIAPRARLCDSSDLRDVNARPIAPTGFILRVSLYAFPAAKSFRVGNLSNGGS